MSNILPSRKQNKSSLHKVLKAVKNPHNKQATDIKLKRQASKKTGIIK